MPPAAAQPTSSRFIVSDTERWARVIKSMDAVKETETAIKP